VKVSKRVREQAIEGLMTIAANRDRERFSGPRNTLDLEGGDDVRALAFRAYVATRTGGRIDEDGVHHHYAAAASLLYAGWKP